MTRRLRNALRGRLARRVSFDFETSPIGDWHIFGPGKTRMTWPDAVFLDETTNLKPFQRETLLDAIAASFGVVRRPSPLLVVPSRTTISCQWCGKVRGFGPTHCRGVGECAKGPGAKIDIHGLGGSGFKPGDRVRVTGVDTESGTLDAIVDFGDEPGRVVLVVERGDRLLT